MKTVVTRRALLVAGAFASSGVAGEAFGTTRVALVIGNAAYPSSPLRNAGNDGVAMSGVLRQLGFTVLHLLDGTKAQLEAAIGQLRTELEGKKAVGMVYFAGHAVQLDWRNYLLPVDAEPASAAEVTRKAIDVQQIIDAFRQAGTRISIVVLDACRDNPFGATSSGKGLAPVDAPPSTFLAYATAPGNVAFDGEVSGRNGVYTRFLLQEMQRPNAKIEDVFKRVRFQVRQATKGRQVPWESTSLEDEFVFSTGSRVEAESHRERERAFLREREDWEAIKQSTRAEDLYAFLQKYPSGPFAEPAQFRLERLAAAVVAIARPRNEIEVLPVERERYRVGDEFIYDETDLYGRVVMPVTYRVTELSGDRVEINDGAVTWDTMGNLITDGNGTRDPAKVAFPANLALGKKWRTDYQVRSVSGINHVFYDMRVVALAEVQVPAGRYRAFKVEGAGWSHGANGRAALFDTYWIDPANFVIVKSLWIRRGYSGATITSSSARELRSLRLVSRI